MTKNFCDHCKKEIKDDDYMKLSIAGSIQNRFSHRHIHLCEKCFQKLNKEINKLIPEKSEESAFA